MILGLLFILIACNSYQHEDDGLSHHPILIKDTFNTKSELLLPFKKWNYAKNNEIFYRASFREDTLFVLGIDENGEAPVTVKIAIQGPNGINDLNVNFYIHNSDSIFILSTTEERIKLYNSEGLLENEYIYETRNESASSTNSDYVPINLVNNYLIFNVASRVDMRSKRFLSSYEVAYALDLETNEIQPISKYNSELEGKYLPVNFLGAQSILVNDSLIYTSYYHDEFIYVYNFNTGKKYHFSGQLKMNHLEPAEVFSNDQDSFTKSLKYPIYQNLLFDKNRQLIYRVVRYPSEILRNAEGSEIMSLLNASKDNIKKKLLCYNLNNELVAIYDLPLCKYFIPSKKGLITEAFYSGQDSEDEFVILDVDRH